MACRSLGMWCMAIDNYAKVAKKVNPLKLRVNELQTKLDGKNAELKLKQD